MTINATMLKIDNIQKIYKADAITTKALDGLSADIAEGEFIAIMGASGSGKTTLLNCISTIDTVSAGHIYLDGTDVTSIREKDLARFRRENLGFIFQELNLMDTLTIRENVLLALTINKLPMDEAEGRVDKMIDLLGIGEIAGKYPYQVSGGQRQRCACARAMVGRPKLILADEPTGSLDSNSAQILMETFVDMHQRMGATILLVTHDAFTASYAQRVIFLRDGKIYSELPRDERSRKEQFERILDTMAVLGGGAANVH